MIFISLTNNESGFLSPIRTSSIFVMLICVVLTKNSKFIYLSLVMHNSEKCKFLSELLEKNSKYTIVYISIFDRTQPININHNQFYRKTDMWITSYFLLILKNTKTFHLEQVSRKLSHNVVHVARIVLSPQRILNSFPSLSIPSEIVIGYKIINEDRIKNKEWSKDHSYLIFCSWGRYVIRN